MVLQGPLRELWRFAGRIGLDAAMGGAEQHWHKLPGLSVSFLRPGIGGGRTAPLRRGMTQRRRRKFSIEQCGEIAMNHDFLFRTLLAATVSGALAGCVSSGSSGDVYDPWAPGAENASIGTKRDRVHDVIREMENRLRDESDPETRRALEETIRSLREKDKELEKKQNEEAKKKATAKCYISDEMEGGALSAEKAFDALLKEAVPGVPHPDPNLLLNWGSGGGGGGGGGGHSKDPCAPGA